MSRHSSKHIIRSVGTWPLIAAVASLTLTSCAAPHQQMAAAAESSGTYVAIDRNERSVYAQTSREGHFDEVDGCLVFKLAGTRQTLTPIFPRSGTSFVSDGTHTTGMVVNGSEVSMGKIYRLDGQVPMNSTVTTAAARVPGECPTSFFLVASVRLADRDIAGLERLCARTIICRSFGLD